MKIKNDKKNFFGFCAYYRYRVKMKVRGSAYCGIDFEGEGKFEDYNNNEQLTLSGSELMKLFSNHLKASDVCEFSTDGKFAFHFGFFEPSNGSFCDIDYIILKEGANIDEK